MPIQTRIIEKTPRNETNSLMHIRILSNTLSNVLRFLRSLPSVRGGHRPLKNFYNEQLATPRETMGKFIIPILIGG